jgi:hypothetical protein
MKDNIVKTNWGLEITWADQDEYCAKILLFEKTLVKTPFIFHQTVKKTFFVNAGNFKFRWIDTANGKIYEKVLEEGSVYTVECLTPWSLESQIEGGSVMQVSNSNDKNDTHIIQG